MCYIQAYHSHAQASSRGVGDVVCKTSFFFYKTKKHLQMLGHITLSILWKSTRYLSNPPVSHQLSIRREPNLSPTSLSYSALFPSVAFPRYFRLLYFCPAKQIALLPTAAVDDPMHRMPPHRNSVSHLDPWPHANTSSCLQWLSEPSPTTDRLNAPRCGQQPSHSIPWRRLHPILNNKQADYSSTFHLLRWVGSC